LCSSFFEESTNDNNQSNMQSVIVFAAFLAVATAAPQFIYSGVPAIAPAVTSSQYHAQDELGQYSYGYAGGPSAKSESKDAFGNVRGSYSYIDGNGLTQTVNYVADPVNGFRVAATNLPVGPAPAPGHAVVAAAPVAHHVAAPVHQTYVAAPHHLGFVPNPVQDTPEVQAAKIQHFAAHNEALARSG